MEELERKVEKMYQNKTEEKQLSYANVTSKQLETNTANIFQKVIKQEKAEEQWIQSTAKNLIFHGVEETLEETEEEQKAGDEKFLSNKVLRAQMRLPDIKIVTTERIGVLTQEREANRRYRPLKVIFKREEDKMMVIKSLNKLSGPYRVTEDLSKMERNIIKEWNEDANKRNLQIKDEDFEWKVRGSPRSKLYLKKILKKSNCKPNKSGS